MIYVDLVFLNRKCWEFHDRICLRVLYFSILRSIMEYGSIDWSSRQDYEYLIKKFERI